MNFKIFLEKFHPAEPDFGMYDHPNAANEPLNLRDVLNKKAGKFIKQAGGELMFRGINGVSKKDDRFIGFVEADNGEKMPAYVFDVRKDRKPAATTKPFHTILDDWFEENQGLKARSETMFCYGEDAIGSTTAYGDTFAVFPVGDFTYTWSPNVVDLWSDMHHLVRDAFEDEHERDMMYRAIRGERTDKATRALLDEFMTMLKYQHNNLNAALKSDAEIMVDADQYIAIALKRGGAVAHSVSAIKSSLK